VKRLIWLSLLFTLPLAAGVIERTVFFGNDNLMFTRADDYDVVEIRGHSVLLKAGAPRVPRVMEKLVIPAGATVVGVEIIAEEWQDVPGFYKLVPAQPDVPLPVPGQEITPQWYAPRPEIYEASEFYPAMKVRLNGVGSMSGYRIAHVELFPVRYQPVSGVLQLATRITYRLSYREDVVSDVIATVRQRAVFGSAVAALVVNPEDVVRFAPRLGLGSRPTFLPPGDYEYVVISAPPMDTVFARLAAWKTRKGIPATVVDIAWISANYTGYDLQEKVRNFIIDAHSTWGTIYVLLGGSGDYRTSGQNIIPTRKGWYTYAGGPDGDSLPSDLYYSDLDGNWDYNGNHIYGQLSDSVDMYSDVYVGRASVYNVALAQNFVYKVMTYEKNPPTDYIEKMLLPTAILWSSYEERPMQDSIARMTPAGWVDAKLYERNGTLSRQRMIDSMNVGFGMGHWVGHGDQNGIYMGSPYLTSSDAQSLVNGDKQGIANSIGCMCGGWDLVPGGDCFAEHLVNRVGGGLVAAVMNARYGFGAYIGYYVPGPSERIDTTFYALIFEEDMFHLGTVHGLAKDAWVFYADSGMQYDWTRWCIYELNLLGDPELPLWSDEPQLLTVDHPVLIPLGSQIVNVTVTSNGSPLSNALVCLQKEDETYASGYTGAAGLATLSVSPTSPGTMHITVTARNHLPYEDLINVQAGNYAFVTYLKSHIDDAPPGGNNNGELNPGESAELPLWVRNWGQIQANNIFGSLNTTDSYATLSDTIKSYGNIPPDDSAFTGTDGYDVAISEDCPNGHSVLFTLTCRDDVDSTWTSQFSAMVYAPVLTYQHVTVIDTNNYVDPGDTVDLVMTIENEGGAAAENVTSALTTTSSYVTIIDDAGNFGTIAPGDTANNATDPYTITADTLTPTGTMADFQVVVTSGVYVDTLQFSLVIGTKHYYIWNPDGTPAPGQNMHTILGNLGYSGDYGTTLTTELDMYQSVFVCVGVWPNNYVIDANSPEALALEDFLENGNGRVYLEGGDVWYYDPPSGYDFGPLFGINATGDGSSDLYSVVGQAGTFTEGMSFGYAGENSYIDHISPSGTAFLVFANASNSDHIGVAYDAGNYRTVGASFELGLLTDGSVPSTREVLLDSIMVFFGLGVSPGIEESAELSGVPMHTALAALYPNPGIRVMSIRYQLAHESAVLLCMYDAVGRLVRTLAEGVTEPGYYTVNWDGRDDLGRRLPAGVYFVRFDTEDYQKVEKAILLK